MYGLVNDVAAWSVFEKPRILNANSGKISFSFEDLTRAFIEFSVSGSETKMRIIHELLKSEGDIKPRELYWAEVIAGLKRRIELG